jgi:hypothetical protein
MAVNFCGKKFYIINYCGKKSYSFDNRAGAYPSGVPSNEVLQALPTNFRLGWKY